MKYSEQVELAKVQKEVRAWLLTNPGPLSAHSVEAVYKLAVKRYGEATGRDCPYSVMVDYLFSVGIQADQVGALFYLRIPGKDRKWADKHRNTPTRIDG